MTLRAEDRDSVLLHAMVSSAKHALEFVAGFDFAGFAADEITNAAVQSVLGTMGRAAAKVSVTARGAAPEVEWQRMADFADYLLCDYDKVTPDEVWIEVQETVPVVIHAVEPLLPPLPADSASSAEKAEFPAVRLNPSAERIAEFCRKWRVDELALFGSVLRDDFGPESDVDVLLTFAPDGGISLFDYTDIQDDLEAIFGRHVDVVSKRGIEQGGNPYSIHNILGSARVIYATAERLEGQTQ